MVMKFESDEILHILISVITISVAFSLFTADFWTILLTLGIGFILHELAHKYVAQSYGAYAVYRAWNFGLVLALVLAIFTQGRFIFAAPGAVVIYGRHLTAKQNGKIAIAGSMMNLFLSIIFYIGSKNISGFEEIGMAGAYINAFLGAFNMIPVFPLDGQKVKSWSEQAWLAITAACFGMLFLLMFGII